MGPRRLHLPPRALRVAVVLCTAAAVGLLGWVLWTEVGTDVVADRTQARLLEQWQRTVPQHPDPDASSGVAAARDDASGPVPPEVSFDTPPLGEPVATLRFVDGDTGQRMLRDEDLVIVSGTGYQQLATGAGHYPASPLPATRGNFAVAGHRTTWGAPFNRIDELDTGDLVLVADTRGWTWRYRVVASTIVDPSDTSVIGFDPLGLGRASITLTTCHPKGSARQRLVVHGVLDGQAPTDQADTLLAAGD